MTPTTPRGRRYTVSLCPHSHSGLWDPGTRRGRSRRPAARSRKRQASARGSTSPPVVSSAGLPRSRVTAAPLRPPPPPTPALPGLGGRIKALPEDCEVEGVPASRPSGRGDSLSLWVEKRDLGAESFVRQGARRLALPPGAVGTAGLKD